MAETMHTVRFHTFGEPADVLQLDTAEVPQPGPGQIRIAVSACGIAPADWALCRGLFPGELPRGIGCDAAGAVDAIGAGVTGVALGDLVFGTTTWATAPTGGASEHTMMDRWFPVPEGLGVPEAAALPMALDSADIHLWALGIAAGRDLGATTLLVNGAGTTVGGAAVQIAIARGARVIATAGQTYAAWLRELGAEVTPYGEGVVERVRAIAGGPVDLVFDTAPVGGALPDLITLAGGDPRRVLTNSDMAAARKLGARFSFGEDLTGYERFGAFPEFAQRAAEGRFAIPIARTFALEDWRDALELSLSGRPRGKLLLIP